MHHWCTRTCYSFSPLLADYFRDRVGKDALQHDYLMDALLSITSLHIACDTEDVVASRFYAASAFRYHQHAISGLCKAIQDISAATCVAIFAASAMILVGELVLPLLPGHTNDSVKSTTELVLPVITHIRGIGAIVRSSRQWLLRGPLGKVIHCGIRRGPSAIRSSLRAQELRLVNDALLSSHYGTEKVDLAKIWHRVFQDAIQGLDKFFDTGISMLPWLVEVDPMLWQARWAKESMAVAIFMQWGVLLCRLDDMWWSKFVGKIVVREMAATLKTRGNEWNQIVQWCEVQVGLCHL